jgi:RecG-like helicase
MANLRQLLTEIDTLNDEELEMVYRHIVQRRHASYWLVPGDQLKPIQQIMRPVYEATQHLDDEEIDAAIDQALDEVRREHQANRGD